MSGTVTWRELVCREHRLAQLKRRVTLVRDTGAAPSFCANAHWYGAAGHRPGLKEELARLVGEDARRVDPVLGTHLAYEVAVATLRGLLPPCRNCACARPAGGAPG